MVIKKYNKIKTAMVRYGVQKNPYYFELHKEMKNLYLIVWSHLIPNRVMPSWTLSHQGEGPYKDVITKEELCSTAIPRLLPGIDAFVFKNWSQCQCRSWNLKLIFLKVQKAISKAIGPILIFVVHSIN